MPTTFVTAFLDLGEDRSKDKSVERCCKFFSRLADTGITLHVFLSKNYQQIYETIVGPRDNVTLEFIELQELEAYQDVNTIEYGMPEVRTHYHDTKNFLILINSKIELVHRVMRSGSGSSEPSSQYAWIDFSIYHVFKDVDTTGRYIKMLGSSTLKNGLYIPGCWERSENGPSFSSVCWRFCGGFFIGDTASIEKFYVSHRSLFKTLVSLKGLSWEVNLWAWLEYIGHLSCIWVKADHNDSIVRLPSSAFKVVASLTTIPPRAKECQLAIESLIDQVDHIYLSVCKNYDRFGPWELPEYLTEKRYGSKLTVVFTEDRGPATKYVGGLGHIPADSWVFVCDDDQEYHPTLISRMKESIKELAVYQNHYNSIVKKTSGGLIHGYVGLLVPASFLRSLASFPLPRSAYFVDDQWMSIYCFLNSMRIYQTRAEAYSEIYKVMDGWHEKIGAESLASLNNRDEMVRAIAKEFSVKFDGAMIHKI